MSEREGANPIVSGLEYWLVNHPGILNFSWNPPHTPASSLLFLSLSLLSYLSLTLLLSLLPLPPVPPRILKPITAVHSLTLLLLSLTMSLGCTLTILTHTPHLHWIICLPPRTKSTGPLFFWAYVFYLSKILEFIDTLLIILSRSIRRLSFLHVYHHATVLLMCYLWLQTSQSLFPVALVTNASVHVVMYGYYFLSALGIRPRWKRVVTDCQIVQFLFSFAVSVLMLYYHFSSSHSAGCSGIYDGKTATGAAGTVCQRSLNKVMNFLTISLRNSSSRVNISKRRKERMYLNGMMRRMVAEDNNSNATSVVI